VVHLVTNASSPPLDRRCGLCSFAFPGSHFRRHFPLHSGRSWLYGDPAKPRAIIFSYGRREEGEPRHGGHGSQGGGYRGVRGPSWRENMGPSTSFGLGGRDMRRRPYREYCEKDCPAPAASQGEVGPTTARAGTERAVRLTQSETMRTYPRRNERGCAFRHPPGSRL
jgi:hypothetical protein